MHIFASDGGYCLCIAAFTIKHLLVLTVISYSGCCWISLARGGSSWLVTTSVNLTRRSDNGRINSSPISRSAAYVRFQEGCPHSLRIPVEDPDGDVVKCRHSTYSESQFNSDSFPYGVLDEVNKCIDGWVSAQ